ncbi:MAG: radical SAM protein [Magnetospirillum sp. WYHS-4]
MGSKASEAMEEHDEAWWADRRAEALNARAAKGEVLRIPSAADSRFDLRRFLASRPAYPPSVNVSISDECNLKCTMCPMYGEGYESLQGDKHHGTMSFENWKRLIDSVPDMSKTSIGPASWGEPLLNKRIFDMIGYALDKGARTLAFNTNGTALTDRNVDRLLDLAERKGADFYVQVSLDGFKESCESQRVGVDYDRVHAALCRFIEENRKRGNPIRLSTDLSRVRQPREECDRFIDYWCRKGLWQVVVQGSTLQDKTGQGGTVWDRASLLHPELFPDDAPEKFGCEFLRNHLAVRSDLQAYAICCRDWFFSQKEDMGKVRIEEVWNSPHYREIVRRQFENEPGTICHGCEYKFRELSKHRERDIWFGKHLYRRVQTFYSDHYTMDPVRYRETARD